MQFLRKTNIDFTGRRKLAYIVSSSLIIIGIISLLLHGGPNYGIDFKGGTLIELKFEKPVKVGEIRSSIGKIGLASAVIKESNSSRDIIINAPTEESGTPVSEQIKEVIKADYPDNSYEVLKVDKVGPKIGHELIWKAVKAILMSLVLILIYISWRFQFKFAVGAIIALFHDVMITLGIFSLLNLELNLTIVAALLTIVGYSLNDTIVVYDRIRENLKMLKRAKYADIINKSVNETLSRTVITSGTTLIVVVILFFFGGSVIKNFSFALLVGVVVGTYSSIFVASPIVLDWQLRDEMKSRLSKK